MRHNQSPRNERMDRYEGSPYRGPRDISSARHSEWELERRDYRADRGDRIHRSEHSDRPFSSPREERSNFGAGSSYGGTTGTTYGSYGRDEYGARSNADFGSSRGASFDRNERGYQGYDRNESDMEGRGYESADRASHSFSSAPSSSYSHSNESSAGLRTEGRSFAGRGPKGYKRSDDRIKEDVSEMLARDHSIDASDIEVEVKEGEVTLSGTIPERRMKHLSEECAERTFGVRDVINQLRVRRDSASDTSSESASRSSSMGSPSPGASGTSSSAAKRSSSSLS